LVHGKVAVDQSVPQPLGQTVLWVDVKQNVVIVLGLILIDNALEEDGFVGAGSGAEKGHGFWTYVGWISVLVA
jgi:hypothetical protein